MFLLQKFCFIHQTITYDVQILFTSIQSGEVNDSQQIVEVCFMITRDSEFKFCPGLDEKRYYEDYHSPIGYHLKSVRLWDRPFKRIDSCNCLLWYKIAKNTSLEDKAALVVQCKACKCLYSDLEWQIFRSADVSPSKKAKRLLPSSTFPLKFLSPKSVAKERE